MWYVSFLVLPRHSQGVEELGLCPISEEVGRVQEYNINLFSDLSTCVSNRRGSWCLGLCSGYAKRNGDVTMGGKVKIG